ncbi:MAG TPA: metallophosphoesterase [Acidimicrobiia bacterium]|nr:metallophosphoesterase [Acidimicrobiia bacterium]
MGRRRVLGAIAPVVLFVSTLAAVGAPPAGATAASQLRRYPYLTDAVGTAMTVNWGTDRSATTGSLRWGAVDGAGNCTPTNTVTATKTGITVNSVAEYQWKAMLTLPATGTYCYRVFLATTDLLGTDASPRFTTQVPAGSTQPFSFAVIGDWGQTDTSGNNADQANVLSQIANSGVQFAMTVGDNGYPSGSQTNYGDLQQKAANVSAIFGPSFWAVPGRSIPIFPTSGNHGFTASATSPHTELLNWPQDRAVAASNGSYVKQQYCCVNGTNAAYYSSAWYAFDAGNARFYVLQATWADTNTGTGTVYSDDYAAHWTPSSPEYQWLQADLAAHPGGLKFAFFHYPMYSDQKAQSSDTFLRGPNSLEGLLASNGVNLAFNGHAHVYERNTPNGPGTIPSYVTGGGGGTLQPIGESGCSSWDAYAIGWSPTKSKGSRCGAAPVPDAASRVFHFLEVTVNGAQVTVAPTDELGRTFDVQTYNFSGAVPPDTVIDAAPPAATNATSASVAFHATLPGATFTCSVDGGGAAPCTSPLTLTGLAEGAHSVSVAATSGGLTDPTPAVATWTVDTTAPPAPTGLSANAASSVTLSWTASSDPTGIASYDVLRDGVVVTSVPGSSTSALDSTVAPNTTYQYQVVAHDGAGNVSQPSAALPVTTPPAATAIFSDGFESGSLSAWTSSSGLTVQGAITHNGAFAAQANTTTGATYAKKTLPSTYTDAYSRVFVNLQSASSQVNLLRHRTASDASLAYVFVTASGQLGVRNDVAATTTMSALTIAPGSGWHEVELHTIVNGTSSTIEVWLDGVRVDALSSTGVNLGTAAVGRMQIGEVQSGRTYNVVFDDAAFGTQRVGP